MSNDFNNILSVYLIKCVNVKILYAFAEATKKKKKGSVLNWRFNGWFL